MLCFRHFGNFTLQIGSTNRSKFEIAISMSIFELERRSKAQNVANNMAYLNVHSTSGTTSGVKDRPDLKMAAILKISKYFR